VSEVIGMKYLCNYVKIGERHLQELGNRISVIVVKNIVSGIMFLDSW
jgi:hypothetical protein